MTTSPSSERAIERATARFKARYRFSDAQARTLAEFVITPDQTRARKFNGLDGRDRPVFTLASPFPGHDDTTVAIARTGAATRPYEPVRDVGPWPWTDA